MLDRPDHQDPPNQLDQANHPDQPGSPRPLGPPGPTGPPRPNGQPRTTGPTGLPGSFLATQLLCLTSQQSSPFLTNGSWLVRSGDPSLNFSTYISAALTEKKAKFRCQMIKMINLVKCFFLSATK